MPKETCGQSGTVRKRLRDLIADFLDQHPEAGVRSWHIPHQRWDALDAIAAGRKQERAIRRVDCHLSASRHLMVGSPLSIACNHGRPRRWQDGLCICIRV